MKNLILCFCLLASGFSFPLFSQQKNFPLNREWGLDFEKYRTSINDSANLYAQYNKNPCFYPHTIAIKQINKNDSIRKKTSFIKRKLKIENLIIVNDTAGKFYLTIDPLFNFEFGKDVASTDTFPEKLYKNTRGILVRGDIGKNCSFESSFLENQATFPNYIDDYIQSTDTAFTNASYYPYHVIPGQGRSKVFKKNGYDFGFASGYISYSPSKHFNFQAGHGKHFAGDGYRSLLLSDNAFNYPFLRITASFGKIQYTNLYTSFMNLTDGGMKTPFGTERLFQKKAGNFQFLSWDIHKRIQLGFFNGLVWQASDSMNNQCLRMSYISPVIYTSALTEGLNGSNNVLLGATLKLKLTNSISFYGQYMMDDFSAVKNSLHNKTGFQAGAKYFDLFGANNLHLQLEYNQVRPYSYTHEKSSQSYTHYNQSLAHPLGANFKEAIIFLNYRIGDFFTEIKINYAITGKDSIARNYGNNIFSSDANAFYGINSTINEMTQGVETTLKILDFHIGYLVNPSTNFNILVGISNRNSTSTIENSQTNFVYFGIRTSISNVYYDF